MLNDKNSTKISKNSKILIGLTAFLTISYFLSFTKSCSSADKREKLKTALVNQKYLDSISFISLQDAGGSLELNNYKGFWTLNRLSDYSSSQFQEAPSIPVSQERMNNFLNEITTIRNMYKISDKISKNSSLGLTNGTEFHITYSIPDSKGDQGSFHELIFGNQDFSLSSRYLITGQSTQVYEIDSSMDTYLTTSIQSWAEPYIISRQIISTDIQTINKKAKPENIAKLLELRHGGLPELSELSEIINQNQKSQTELEIENGDKSRIILDIYQRADQEDSYIIKAEYYMPDSKTAFYTAWLKISSWTYNKIKEITL